MVIPLLESIKTVIIDPFLAFLAVIAFVYFLWGLLEFMMGASEPAKRAAGQQHMIWSVVGLAIMFSVFGILNLVCATVGC